MKKWKEMQKKIMHKDEVARMKNKQKEHGKMELDKMMNIPEQWNLPVDHVNNDDAMEH